ncbi:MAG: chemotaxis protein CheW [Sideroxyarcus sp.]|nr:chemotaxis protein CheW [Sideroxyarcus sp.]
MKLQPLLIFDLDGARFGVDATRVQESFWLPELTPVEEAPLWVVGLFCLRGRMVPVADLHLRFGHPARRYTPDDQVVVLEADQLQLGLIVSEIREVIDLPGDAIQPPQFDAGISAPAHLVVGQARLDDGLVTLLDVDRLVHQTHLHEEPAFAEEEPQLVPTAHFCPEATPAERALFHTRALALREAAADEEGTRLGLAVVEICGEYFGVELADVLEFCNIAELSPIPCCPPHILGAMSLRGELLSVIDPRSALNLPLAAKGSKAVVALLGERAVGIAVDEVHDVVYLKQEELQAPPAALRELCGASITGTAPYADRMMTVLDLPALLAREEWIVNEAV